MTEAVFAALSAQGLNLQAVFAVAALPAAIREALPDTDAGEPFAQLILIGNAGPALWRAVEATNITSADPIDDFSTQAVCRWLDGLAGGGERQMLYPGTAPVGLQTLGNVAGWHHPSPFMVGIQPHWGTWFAYRAVVLANTRLPISAPVHTTSPCNACGDRPCVRACPAAAMASGRFSLEACLDYRRAPDSACARTCVARLRCPVGAEHRYPEAQIRHAYTHSLRMIRGHEPEREN